MFDVIFMEQRFDFCAIGLIQNKTQVSIKYIDLDGGYLFSGMAVNSKFSFVVFMNKAKLAR